MSQEQVGWEAGNSKDADRRHGTEPRGRIGLRLDGGGMVLEAQEEEAGRVGLYGAESETEG